MGRQLHGHLQGELLGEPLLHKDVGQLGELLLRVLATRIGAGEFVTPATPTTVAATETIPSLAPSTPARSQLRRPAMLAVCGSLLWEPMTLLMGSR